MQNFNSPLAACLRSLNTVCGAQCNCSEADYSVYHTRTDWAELLAMEWGAQLHMCPWSCALPNPRSNPQLSTKMFATSPSWSFSHAINCGRLKTTTRKSSVFPKTNRISCSPRRSDMLSVQIGSDTKTPNSQSLRLVFWCTVNVRMRLLTLVHNKLTCWPLGILRWTLLLIRVMVRDKRSCLRGQAGPRGGRSLRQQWWLTHQRLPGDWQSLSENYDPNSIINALNMVWFHAF